MNEFKTKGDNKTTTNEYRDFLESNFVGANRLFALVYTNEDANAKRLINRRYYLPTGIIKTCNVIINGKKIIPKQLILI